jgi:hypothetical protein
MLDPARPPGDQSLGGPAGQVPRQDRKQMFAGRADSGQVPAASSRPDPLPDGAAGKARRM